MNLAFSPRTWEWTAKSLRTQTFSDGFPHACGGGPADSPGIALQIKFSPRAWGWTGCLRGKHFQGRGFPYARGGGPHGTRA